MLKWIGITDLTKFYGFVYFPVKDMGSGFIDVIKEGRVEPPKEGENFSVYYSVFGVQAGAPEECIADFDTIQEAAGYCMMLNQSLEGKVPH